MDDRAVRDLSFARPSFRRDVGNSAVVNVGGDGRITRFEGGSIPQLGLSRAAVGRRLSDLWSESADLLAFAQEALGGAHVAMIVELMEPQARLLPQILRIFSCPVAGGTMILAFRVPQTAATRAQQTRVISLLTSEALSGTDASVIELALRMLLTASFIDYVHVVRFSPAAPPALELAYGWPEALAPRLEAADWTNSPEEAAFLSDERVLHELGAAEDAALARQLTGAGARSCSCTPISLANGDTRVLAAYARETAVFGREECDFLDAIANIISQADQSRAYEDEIRKREEWLSAVLLQAPDGIVITDESGTIVSANGETERMFGYESGELTGMSIGELVPPDQRSLDAEWRSSFHADPQTRAMAPNLDIRGWRKDGSDFAAEINLSPLQRDTGLQIIATVRDVTARRQTELELQRSNAELEQFAYIASHDLQEPLRTVVSFTQLLARRYRGKLGTDADEFIAYAVDGANRMQALINDLLSFSRVRTSKREISACDAGEVLAGALVNLQVAIGESGASVTAEPLPNVLADPIQLEQLFQNLIGNGVKFRGDEPPKLHVSARRRRNDWLFEVRDNGIGIDPQYAERIFGAFQRLHTREEYPGTGIGLAICKKIVERHGGRIWVESQPGQGSTFCFTLGAVRRRALSEQTGATRPGTKAA